MRIGYLTYGLDRAPTGIGRSAVQLLRAMAALPDGPEVVVLATEREDRHGLGAICEYHALPNSHLLPAVMTIGNVLINQAIRRHGLDLLHDPNGIAPFLGSRGAAPRIVTIHDAFAYIDPGTHNRLDNWRYRWHLPLACRQADAVITVSDCSRRDLIRFLPLAPNKVHVIAGGVDAQFRPIPDGAARRAVLDRYRIEQPYILYVGGINARKNVARLLEAYAVVRERHPNLTLVIGGKRQWQCAEVDAAFRRLALAEQVRFTGYVDDADLPSLYSAAEAFVFPSLYEGFGLPPLEAMACGVPVVTSNVSSLPEVVGDAALSVDPRDVGAIAAAIARVLDDRALRTQLRWRGLARVVNYSWERAARETVAVYEQTLRRPKAMSTAIKSPTGEALSQ